MILSHKIALDPTVKQRIALAKAAGVARFTWNYALAEWDRQYKAGMKPKANALKKQFNAIKGQQFPWVYESPKEANQQPFSNLFDAFQMFFKKKAKHPRFKKKGVHDSFYTGGGRVKLADTFIVFPVIGKIRITEPLRFEGEVISAVASRVADRWFVSVAVDVRDYKKNTGKRDVCVGVDLGISSLATLSTGEKIEGPKALKKNLKVLRRRCREVSRKVKGSKNRWKAKQRLGRAHYRISCLRKDALHKLTTRLCRENQAVVVEDLNVKGMVKNRRLARSISDMGWGEFRRQLEYKAPIYGTRIVIADRFFPSSKTCSNCGVVRDAIALSERVFHCPDCGYEEDRDVNAAINLCRLGSSQTNACGEELPVRTLVEAGTKPHAEMRAH